MQFRKRGIYVHKGVFRDPDFPTYLLGSPRGSVVPVLAAAAGSDPEASVQLAALGALAALARQANTSFAVPRKLLEHEDPALRVAAVTAVFVRLFGSVLSRVARLEFDFFHSSGQ